MTKKDAIKVFEDKKIRAVWDVATSVLYSLPSEEGNFSW